MQSSVSKLEELYQYCVMLFGIANVSKEDLTDPESIEITVCSDSTKGNIKEIELALYRGDYPQSFMHIDEFTFEYDANEEKAIKEMHEYLNAFSQQRLHIESWNILGFNINKRLIIRN
jgi:hypothetical protein